MTTKVLVNIKYKRFIKIIQLNKLVRNVHKNIIHLPSYVNIIIKINSNTSKQINKQEIPLALIGHDIKEMQRTTVLLYDFVFNRE